MERSKLTSFAMAGMFDGAGGANMNNITHFKFSGYRIFLRVRSRPLSLENFTKEVVSSLTLSTVYSHRHPAVWHLDYQCEALAPESLSPHILVSVVSAVFDCVKRPLCPLVDCWDSWFHLCVFIFSGLSVPMHRLQPVLSNPVRCGSAHRPDHSLPSASNGFGPALTIAAQDCSIRDLLNRWIVSDLIVEIRCS